MDLDNNHALAIAYVNLNTMRVTLNNGDTLPITNLFDDLGDECEPDDAVSLVAGANGKGLVSCDIRELKPLDG